MFTNNLTNKLYPKSMCINGSDKLLLISSNSCRSSLFTFNSKDCIQPITEHCPFYINTPKETSNMFPFLNNGNSFITGMQILPGKYHSNKGEEEFFSIALLNNYGDIYMQDFWSASESPEPQSQNVFTISQEFGGKSREYQYDFSSYMDSSETNVNDSIYVYIY